MAKQDYGIRKTVALGFDDAVERTRELLQTEGFGVLTEIDMKAKLKEKIGADIQRYLILGACNPRSRTRRCRRSRRSASSFRATSSCTRRRMARRSSPPWIPA